MNKKITLSLAALIAVIAGITGMAAFEAHVINVTAKIENALSVTPNEIAFGTVFPQEYTKKNLTISLSDSFKEEGRVDDVNYVIKQKPKVRPNDQNPEGDPYATIYPDGYSDGIVAHEYCLNNRPTNADDPDDPYYTYCYPILCPYLSKHKADDDNTRPTDTCIESNPTSGNPYYDCGVNAFHNIGENAYGHLVKSADDNVDKWVIDLAAPCFDGQCDQTYDEWVWRINPDVANPWDWTLPAGMEGQTFGCDLWIEVTGISESEECVPTQEVCDDGIDNDCDGLVDCDDSDCDNDPACQNVVINEVAWMGMPPCSTNDEWMELRNLTDRDIDLSDWTLNAADGEPEIDLTGVIPANGYYLLERTNDDTVPNIVADQIYTGALGDNGEKLELRNVSGDLIDSVDGSGGWPAGSSTYPKDTMERCETGATWRDSLSPGGTPKAFNTSCN